MVPKLWSQAGADLVGAYTVSSAPDRNPETMNATTESLY